MLLSDTKIFQNYYKVILLTSGCCSTKPVTCTFGARAVQEVAKLLIPFTVVRQIISDVHSAHLEQSLKTKTKITELKTKTKLFDTETDSTIR